MGNNKNEGGKEKVGVRDLSSISFFDVLNSSRDRDIWSTSFFYSSNNYVIRQLWKQKNCLKCEPLRT